MKFFNVKSLSEVKAMKDRFEILPAIEISIEKALGSVLAEDISSTIDIPDFNRSTMDGFAVQAKSVFGASEAAPAYLTLTKRVEMGKVPDFSVGPLEAARILTGGMLPDGADAVVMIEHTESVDASSIEVYKSVAPGQHVIFKGEDMASSAIALKKGTRIRPQEMGLLAALGCQAVTVCQKPVAAIISTGDEVVPIDENPAMGKIRDVNTYTLMGQLEAYGASPLPLGIVRDDFEKLSLLIESGLEKADVVCISGGSSLGARDFTIDVIKGLPDSEILAHGIAISPGKPTIIARSGKKLIFGLPGHITSCMVVVLAVVAPFLNHIRGLKKPFGLDAPLKVLATLSRNISSVQGRTDFIRVRLFEDQGTLYAEPLLGKSGLIHTMVNATGLLTIPQDTEGVYEGDRVFIYPFD